MTTRPRLDQLTDDQLDQLYAEVERMKLLVAASSEDGQAVRMAAQYAERAIENGERADRAEQLAADLRTQVITEQKAAEQAEAAIERVRALHAPGRDWSWKPFGCEHHGAHAQPCAHCGVCSPCPTLPALDTTA